ncbi:hypothetical protein TA5114_03422 [Cognatishimia activa]|uniref:Small periplasmic lipoprotein n=1 Tax=Cognatishimia activa TaxID=1715691 RepID=A0A0P1IVD3_9RHOB|nr:hypothetical protein TA5113_02561 [Cognatishimia activa]CUK27594.1 hypothetical protein TA5114_03422 [Cognatishimia activa]
MASSRKSKATLLLLVCGTLLASCAEYRNNWDRVSTRAGNAHMANTAIMEVEPTNTANTGTNVGG